MDQSLNWLTSQFCRSVVDQKWPSRLPKTRSDSGRVQPCYIVRMKHRSFVIAALTWMAAPAAQSSVVPPVEQGTWLSSRMMPDAISKGDYTKITDLLTAETTVSADDGKALAKGKAPTLAYLKQWYSSMSIGLSSHFALERRDVHSCQSALAFVIEFHGQPRRIAGTGCRPHQHVRNCIKSG